MHVVPKNLTFKILYYKIQKKGDLMNYLISKILKFITDQNVIGEDDDVQDFYRYGIEISISSLLNIILVLTVGLLIDHVLESIIFLFLFILIRSFTGGYHADTYFRCNLLMCVTFILTVFANVIMSDKITLLIAIVLACITEIIVFALGPIENKNKPIDDSKKTKLKIIGLIITLTMNCIGIIFVKSYIGTMIIFTCLLIAALMVAAIIKEKRGDICEEA